MIPADVLKRSIKIGAAASVKNMYSEGMEKHEKQVSMNNGVVAYVYNGDYYLTPDGYDAFKKLSEAGFKDHTFMVICSSDPCTQAPAGHEKVWAELRATRS